MSATKVITYRPAWEKPRQVQARNQVWPYVLFFLLVCTPGFTNISSANLSIVLFPFVLFGYSEAAWNSFNALMPGAQKVIMALLGLMLAICLWGIVTAIGVPQFLRVFRPLSGHATGFAIVVAVLALSRTQAQSVRIQRISMAILLVILAATYFIGFRGYGDRMPGTFKHPNQLGPVATMAALFLFAQIVSSTGRQRIMAAIGFLVAVYAVQLSGSKTNLVSLVGLLFLSVILLAFQHRKATQTINELLRNLVLASALVIIGGATLAVTNERAFDVINDIASSDDEETSAGQYRTVVARSDLWAESINMGRLHPLTGVGAGQLMSGGTEHSHNVFMDALRTMGVPGLGLTIAYVLVALWYVVGAYRAARVLGRQPGTRMADLGARGSLVGSLVAMISYIISNQMSDSFGPSTIPFFYMYLAFSMTYFLPKTGQADWNAKIA